MNDLIRELTRIATKPQTDNIAYWKTFVESPTGAALLEDLMRQYWLSTTSHPQEDPTRTAFREGQKSVITVILTRIMQSQQPQGEEE